MKNRSVTRSSAVPFPQKVRVGGDNKESTGIVDGYEEGKEAVGGRRITSEEERWKRG